ncbi:MAG: hypothetical protein ACRCR1_06135 [Aeromonas sp.]
MAIHGNTPVMLKAIDSLQLANVNPGSNQKLALHLGEGKDYTIHIGKSGDVSVQRDLSHLSTLGRIKNAVVDFFSRAATEGESALTTRATQIQSEVQQQLTELRQLKEIVQQAFNQPVSEFKNEAQYLKPGSDPTTATLADVTDSNKNRLGLETMDDHALSVVKSNFSSFINGKEAIFSMLSDRVFEQTMALNESLSGEDLSSALHVLGNESEALKVKVNAEFNRSFIQLLEQRANAELTALTEANTLANRTSPTVDENMVPSAGENAPANMKTSVRFMSDVRMFELEEGRALNIKV